MFKENRKTYTDDEYIVRMWEKEYLQDMAARFMLALSLIHICRCRRLRTCRSRWSPSH